MNERDTGIGSTDSNLEAGARFLAASIADHGHDRWKPRAREAGLHMERNAAVQGGRPRSLLLLLLLLFPAVGPGVGTS